MEESFKKAQQIKTIQNPEAISEVKERYLKKIKVLRFDYIEEFPPEMSESEMPNNQKYKSRTVFFSNVAGVIMVLKRYGLINSVEIKKECEDFFKFCDTIRGTSRLHNQDDIDIANKMLDSLIKELS